MMLTCPRGKTLSLLNSKHFRCGLIPSVTHGQLGPFRRNTFCSVGGVEGGIYALLFNSLQERLDYAKPLNQSFVDAINALTENTRDRHQIIQQLSRMIWASQGPCSHRGNNGCCPFIPWVWWLPVLQLDNEEGSSKWKKQHSLHAGECNCHGVLQLQSLW